MLPIFYNLEMSLVLKSNFRMKMYMQTMKSQIISFSNVMCRGRDSTRIVTSIRTYHHPIPATIISLSNIHGRSRCSSLNVRLSKQMRIYFDFLCVKSEHVPSTKLNGTNIWSPWKSFYFATPLNCQYGRKYNEKWVKRALQFRSIQAFVLGKSYTVPVATGDNS